MFSALQQTPPDFNVAAAIGMIIFILAIIALFAQRNLSGAREKYQTIGGGEDTSTIRSIRIRNRYIQAIIWVLAFFLFVLPYLILVLSSFQQAFLGLNLEHIQWTLGNYEVLLFGAKSERFYQAVFNTVLIAGAGAFLTMMLASLASYFITRADSVIGDAIDFLTVAPVALPGVIVATVFLWVFLEYNILGSYGTIWLILLAFIPITIVYGSRATNASYRAIGDELGEAAIISGADFPAIFREIMFPMQKSGFLSGFILVFITITKVMTVPVILSGTNNQMLSSTIWFLWAEGHAQEAAAVAVILTLIIGIVYLIGDRMFGADLRKI